MILKGIASMGVIDTQKCITLANAILAKQDFSEDEINVLHFKLDKTIMFVTLQDYISRVKEIEPPNYLPDGVTLKYKGKNLVVYREMKTNIGLQNFVLGHELGHIYLDHTKRSNLTYHEAEYFAEVLTMPDFTICMMQSFYSEVTVEDIANVFTVPEGAADLKLHIMMKQGSYQISFDAIIVWEKQKRRVQQYFESKNKSHQSVSPS